MKRVMSGLIVLLVFGIATIAPPAQADTFTFQPAPANLNDLEHHSLYTWRIDGVNLAGQEITNASLTINNIRNWDSNPNRLFIHLLDTVKNAGVASYVDDPTNSAPVLDITDDFVNSRYHTDSKWLVAAGTADTFLTSPTFTTTGTSFVYTLTNPQLQLLASYVVNDNNFALGLDPDCHFFNDGVTLSVTAIPNPEPASMLLLASGLVGLYFGRTHRTKPLK
jgi:PEP-CTERM motif-containing protein